MKFNSLIIDKLNDFNSVFKQSSKKSSLVQFSDIINVYNPDSPETAPIQANAAQNAEGKALFASEQIFQVSPQALKDLSSLLIGFGKGINAQPSRNNEANSAAELSKKEFILSKEQLQAFFNFVLSSFSNSPLPEMKPIENFDQLTTPVNFTLEDGTAKLSITISAQPNNETESNIINDVANISRLTAGATISLQPLNAVEQTESISNANGAISAAQSKNIFSLPDTGSVNNSKDKNILYKVEVLQQPNSAEEVYNNFVFPKAIETVNKFSTNKPVLTAADMVNNATDGKYFVDKNTLDLFSSVTSKQAAAEQNGSTVNLSKKGVPIEQILFGKDYTDGNLSDSILQKNVLTGLSNEEKSTLLESFSAGDILSVEYSHETVKPMEVLPRTANATSSVPNNTVETIPIQAEQQVPKQALIFNLTNEQYQSGNKVVSELNPQLRDLSNQVASLKEQGEKFVVKTNTKTDSQSNDPVALDKQSELKIAVKNDKPLQKNSNDVNANNSDDTKTGKLQAKDVDSNQQEEKDFTRRNTSELFKNSVLTNSANVSAEKSQFVSELKTLPQTARTITANEIIPEFSKVLQQGEKQTLTFQLSPENLGKVKLTVDMVANSLNARIEVENEQVKQFIQSNIDQLKQNFQSKGIQLSNVSISLADYNDQRGTKAFVPKKKYSGRYLKDGIVEKQTSPSASKLMGYNTYEFLV